MKEFDTRTENIRSLSERHGRKLELISNCFQFLDEIIDNCNARIDDDYYRICGIAIVKGKNYALSCYSLILDGHAQEAGAMARPWWEYLEVLVYFQEDTHRTKQVASNSLPAPGRLSRKVNSSLQGFRQYLNEHAAHRSFGSESLKHILNQDGTIKKQQKASEMVVIRNIRDLFVMLWLFSNESLTAIAAKDPDKAETFLKMAKRLEDLRDQGRVEFELGSSRKAKE